MEQPWAPHQLAEYLGAVSAAPDATAARRAGVRGAAIALGADLVAIVADGRVLTYAGAGTGPAEPRTSYAGAGSAEGTGPAEPRTSYAGDGDADPDRYADALAALPLARTGSRVRISGAGECQVTVVPLEHARARLIVARGGAPLTAAESGLLASMARVLDLSLHALATLDSLRERQELLERLTRIQRSIAARAPLRDVFDLVVAGAQELLGDEIIGLRLIDPTDPSTTYLAAEVGTPAEVLPLASREPVGGGAGGAAISLRRLVVVEEYSRNPQGLDGFQRFGLTAAMAAPIWVDGAVTGSLVVATMRPGRRYSEGEKEMLLAYADTAGLAISDTRVRQALQTALEEARHDAVHDALTGLPNRTLLLDRLGHALARIRRQARSVAVLFVDLDDFKVVNDSLGHGAGDDLLVEVSRRLVDVVRPGDTVSRLGGDEFALLVEDLDDPDDAMRLASRVLAVLADPFCVHGQRIFVRASIGVALSQGESTPEELLRDADVAMYQAKHGGKAGSAMFEPSMQSAVRERMELESRLHGALDRGELVLHYQPIVDLGDRRIHGLEALVRWAHPERGLVPPGEFMPVAEDSGLVVPMGRWVLQEACRQTAEWLGTIDGLDLDAITVNVSPRQLLQSSFVDDVRAALRRSGLDPRTLVLEITENVVLRDSAAVAAKFRALRRLGVRIALDDFGTGYSSLAYLRRLSIDILKIDKAFVDELGGEGGRTTLAQVVVELGSALGLRTVAEGVESAVQAWRLRAMGCAAAQGFWFSRPLPAEQVEQLLRDRRRATVDAPRA